jgi:hypothetical protein
VNTSLIPAIYSKIQKIGGSKKYQIYIFLGSTASVLSVTGSGIFYGLLNYSGGNRTYNFDGAGSMVISDNQFPIGSNIYFNTSLSISNIDNVEIILYALEL